VIKWPIKITRQKQKRIYKASATALTIMIEDNDGTKIGVLTLEPSALSALSWLRKNKQEPSRKTKTPLNLVEWMEQV
jgi:hypothetical protein